MRHITKILFLLLLFGSVLPILPVAAQDAPCTVNSARRNGARLRETPARNGKAIGYLPTGIEFNVVGSFKDNRRGIWFLLIKEQLDPAITSAEVWVAATTVKTTGNCDVVPSLNPPEPIFPQAGIWNLQSDSMGTISCVDAGQVVVPLSELGLTSAQFEERVRITRGGFSIEGAPFTPTNDGKFTGMGTDLEEIGIDNGLMLLVVESNVRMTGTAIFNIVLQDGTQCSLNINVAYDWLRER